jgi:hypothetical protein
MVPYDPAECPIVKIKVTPALVRKHTGVTVSKNYCRYIADRMSEYFGWNEYGAKHELAGLVEAPDEDYVRPTMTDTIEIEVNPYLLREVWNKNRRPLHPCTADDLLRVAKYIDKHYLTSDNGGFELVREAMENEGVWYGEDDRDDNPAFNKRTAAANAKMIQRGAELQAERQRLDARPYAERYEEARLAFAKADAALVKAEAVHLKARLERDRAYAHYSALMNER